MTNTRPLSSSSSVIIGQLIIVLLFLPFQCVYAQDADSSPTLRNFEGIYFGGGIGTQNVFAGVLVNDVFVSKQQSGLLAEFSFGHRWQFVNDRVSFALEVQLGLIDGNVEQALTNFPEITIAFSNNSQVGLGYNAGYIVDRKRNLLVYLYLYQVRRNFTLSSIDSINQIQLGDESQTTLRYGLGLEYSINRRLNARFNVGTLTDDTGDVILDSRLEIMTGLVYQF
jgi:hypothetical protein